jgi:crotonobetainyl-CoA:carnitine CoA-transferase CaiB-like acyl-CoA transferase
MIEPVDHPRAGRSRIVASPIHMDRTPPRRPRPAPLLGQHGRDVLAEAGLSGDEIEQLVAAGVLGLTE